MTLHQTRPPCPPPAHDVPGAHRLIAHLQAQLAAAGQVHRAPPPEPTTCCGRGCNGCVWEGYYAALSFWREDALVLLDTPSVG